MNDTELDRRLRAWYRDQVSPSTSAPDALRGGLAAITDMAPPGLFAAWRGPILLVAAALLAALAGAMIIGSRPVPPTPSPSPSASLTTLPVGPLEPGTYSFDGAFSVTVPAGWAHEGNFLFRGDPFDADGVAVSNWIVSRVYADSCRWTGTLRDVGSAAELATALADQTGHQTSGPTGAILGGDPAIRFEFSVPADFDASVCDVGVDAGLIRLWPTVGLEYAGAGLWIDPGQTTTIYVIDQDGSLGWVIATVRNNDSPAAAVAELEQVIASIRFER